MRFVVRFCVTRGHERKSKADNWNVLVELLFLVRFVFSLCVVSRVVYVPSPSCFPTQA